MKNYSIKYEVTAGKFTKEDPDVVAGKAGLTDAIMLMSVVNDGATAHEGSKSFSVLTRDGRGVKEGEELDLATAPEMADTEIFQIMTTLADYLITSNARNWQKSIAELVMEMTRDVLASMKENPQNLDH